MADHTLLANYKTHYGIAGTGSDALLNSLIPKVVRKIRTLTNGLTLETGASAVTEVHDGDGYSSAFYTRQRPIRSITTIHESTAVPRAYDADSLVDSDTYGHVALTGKVRKLAGKFFATGSVWAKGYDTVQIIYVPGYADEDAIPDDLLEALYLWVRVSQLRIENGREGIRSVNAADGSVTYELAPIPAEVKPVLEAWTPLSLGGQYA